MPALLKITSIKEASYPGLKRDYPDFQPDATFTSRTQKDPCRHMKGNEKMITGTVKRLIGALMIIMVGTLPGNALAADEAGSLSLAEALSQTEIFADLTETERNALQTVAQLRRGKAGERLIEQGKATNKMYIILEGKCEILINGKPLTSFSGQSLVGEIEFLDSLPASADVVLLEEATFIELDNKALGDLMDKNPRMGYVLMREIARIEGRRLRATN